MARPYGVGLLIGGVDDKGPQLFQTDPSGTFCQWQANAIGSGQETALTQLKEQYHATMNIEDAQKMVLSILKGVMEDKITKENVELMIIRTSNKQWEKPTQEQI